MLYAKYLPSLRRVDAQFYCSLPPSHLAAVISYMNQEFASISASAPANKLKLNANESQAIVRGPLLTLKYFHPKLSVESLFRLLIS